MHEYGSTHGVSHLHPHPGIHGHSQNHPAPAQPGASPEMSPMAEMLLNPSLGAKRMNVAVGRVLYEPQSPTRALYFVHRGQIRTYRIDGESNGRLLDILGPEDWCGEAALARYPQYGEQATAVVASVVTEVPVDRLFSLMAQQPKSAMEFVRQVGGQAQRLPDGRRRVGVRRLSRTAGQDPGALQRILRRRPASRRCAVADHPSTARAGGWRGAGDREPRADGASPEELAPDGAKPVDVQPRHPAGFRGPTKDATVIRSRPPRFDR